VLAARTMLVMVLVMAVFVVVAMFVTVFILMLMLMVMFTTALMTLVLIVTFGLVAGGIQLGGHLMADKLHIDLIKLLLFNCFLGGQSPAFLQPG